MADPLSIASSIAGLISIGDVVFRKIYHYAKSVAKAESEVINLKNEVATLTGVLHNLRLVAQELEDDSTIHNSVRIDHVNSCLATLYKINGLLSKIEFSKEKRISNAIQKLKWPMRSSETKELSSEVQRHRETLSLALSADSMNVLLQTLSSQKDIINHLDKIDRHLQKRERAELRIALDNERKRVLRSFFTVEPRQYLETVLDMRHPTTGFWLVQNDTFQAWLQEPGSRLWLSGIPGAGKTIFSGLIVQECFAKMGKNTVVAYFYCDYKNQASLSIVNLLSALAGQIAMKHESSFLLLQQYYEDLHPPDQMERQSKAEELVDLIHEMAADLDDVRIVIDGLDECGDNTRQAAEWLYKLVDFPSANVSFVLLSRDEPVIRDTFEDLSWDHIEITAHTEDIEHYVRSEIEQRIKNKRLRTRSDELKNLIVEQLISRAQGMFRWVSCQLDHLCELPTDSQRRQALLKLPETLNETYERILLRIKKPAVPLVVKTLQWLVFGVPRLSTEALLDALSIDDESEILDIEARPTEDDVLSCCSSLIRRTGPHLELAHFTVQEFLQTLTSNNPDLAQFQITLNTTSLLAARCLDYLCSSVFDTPPPPDVETLILFREQYPFHAHAAIAWTTYMIDNWTKDNLTELYTKLFDPKRTLNFILYISNRLMDESISAEFDDVEEIYSESSRLVQGTRFRPLHAAAMLGLEPLTQWLVQQGSDIGMACLWGPPLEICYASILADRPEYGLDLNYINFDEAMKTVIYLINSGAERNFQDQQSKIIKERVEILLGDMKSSRKDPEFLKTVRLLEEASLMSASSTEIMVVSDDGFLERLKKSVELDQIQHVHKLIGDTRISFEPVYQDRTIIDIAASSGALQVLELMLDHYADTIRSLVNTPLKAVTPLHYSLSTGTEASSIFLLDITDSEHAILHDANLVHLCVARGFCKMLQKLLVRGVNASAVTDRGRSAWFYVTPWTNEEIYTLLITSQSNPLLADTLGCIPLQAILDGTRNELFHKYDIPDWRVAEGFFTEEMIEYLITPASVQCKDPEGRSIWSHFCVRYIPRFIRSKVLLINSRFELLGQRLVHCKALEAHAEVSISKSGIDLLIENVIEVNPRDVAVRAHQKQVALMFVSIFSLKDTKYCGEDDHMRALLMWAIDYDERDLIKVLLEQNIDIHVGSALEFGMSVIGACASNVTMSESFAELMKYADPERINERDGTGKAPIHYVCGAAKSTKSTRTLSAQRLCLLLDTGADKNITDESRRTPLHIAADLDFVEGIQILLDHGADIHRRDADGMNICNHAAAYGSMRTLEYLYRILPDDDIWQNLCTTLTPTGHRYGNCTNLHLAALRGHVKVLNFLKSSKRLKDLNPRMEVGHTPLHLATMSGREKTVRWLIDEGAELDAVTQVNNATALHFAMAHSNLPAIRALIEAGASLLEDNIGQTPWDLLSPDSRGDLIKELEGLSLPGLNFDHESASNNEKALFAAIRTGNIKLCQSLIHQNPRFHSTISRDCGTCTPLIAALCPVQEKCFVFLLSTQATTASYICEKHSESDTFVTRGFSPIHIAVTDPTLNPKLSMLLDLSYQHQDHWSLHGVSPIHVASAVNANALPILYDHVKRNADRLSHFDFHSFADWLSDRYAGVPPGYPRRKCTPLHTAAHYSNYDSVKFLLDHDADVSCLDGSGDTALHFASRGLNVAILDELLSRGADPNARNHSLQTPLHSCAQSGTTEIAQRLISSGADKDAVDARGRTALYMAAMDIRMPMFITLLEAGCDPYIANMEGESALTAALATEDMRSYVLNKGFDRVRLIPPIPSNAAHRHSELSAETAWHLHKSSILRALTDEDRVALVNTDAPWTHALIHSAAAGQLKAVQESIKYGSEIEYCARGYGSALIAACQFNRLNVVKYLVQKGAKFESSINGQPITAIHAAYKFPNIVHWLLVGRYYEQSRLCYPTSTSDHTPVRPWSGVRALAIPLEGRFAKMNTETRLAYVRWIHDIRKEWKEMVPLDWKPVLFE